MSKRGVLGVDHPTQPTVPPMTGKEWDDHGWRGRAAYCPICEEPLSVRAARSPDGHPHFSHRAHSGCPTIAERRVPFEHLLAGVPRDPAAGRELRAQCVASLYATYLNVKELAPGLSIDEFRGLVRRADALDVWQLRGMTMPFVPYVLVLCADDFAVTTFRREAFYFVFAKRHPRVDDLWNTPGAAAAVGLWRVYPADRTFEFEPLRPAGLWTPAWVEAFARQLQR